MVLLLLRLSTPIHDLMGPVRRRRRGIKRVEYNALLLLLLLLLLYIINARKR